MSPHCWLCEAPKRLVVPQKMPGQPKISRLPTKKMAFDLERGLRVRPMPYALRPAAPVPTSAVPVAVAGSLVDNGSAADGERGSDTPEHRVRALAVWAEAAGLCRG